MKHGKALIIYMVLIALVMIGLSISANAEDKMLSTKIDSATIATDKNGSEYVRFIVTEPRQLNGVEYDKALPLMAFGANVEPAKAYKAGDVVKCIANYRKLPDGRESYTIISFVK